MFGSLLGDLVKIALAPVQIAAAIAVPVVQVAATGARVVTKPLADVAQETVKIVEGK